MIVVRAAAGVICACLCLVSPWAIADVLYVNVGCGDDDWTGLSSVCKAPDGPKATIQAAMNEAITGDTVLVADGTYPLAWGSFPGGQNFTVRSENGPQSCIIDAQGAGPAFFLVVEETPEAVLDGFTFTNGRHDNGGAIHFHHGSRLTVANCILTGNTSTGSGGGIAVANDSFGPTIINCTITGNTAERDGGGIFFSVFVEDRTRIINSTIADNTAGRAGGGVFFLGSADSNTTVGNSILWGNSGDQISGSGSATVTFSDVQGGFEGEGNIDDNPLFVDPDNGDYHIANGSPAIDAGDPTFLPEPGDIDIDGQKRIWNGRVDMGSDEFGSFAFGDLNCDGAIDAFDIEPFLGLLF